VDGQPHLLNSRVLAIVTTVPTTGRDTTDTGRAWFNCDGTRVRFALRLDQGIRVSSPQEVPRVRLGKSGPLGLDEARMFAGDDMIISEIGVPVQPLIEADTIWVEFTPEHDVVPWTAIVPMDGAGALVDRLKQRCEEQGG
jgi:hypothetical protein